MTLKGWGGERRGKKGNKKAKGLKLLSDMNVRMCEYSVSFPLLPHTKCRKPKHHEITLYYVW